MLAMNQSMIYRKKKIWEKQIAHMTTLEQANFEKFSEKLDEKSIKNRISNICDWFIRLLLSKCLLV